MASQFSDPAWWPKPPPKPPQRISPAKIVFGTLLPIAAVAAVVVLIVEQQSQHSPRSSAPPSIQAFEACLRAHGVTSGEQGSAVSQAAGACKSELPSGTQPQAFERPQTAKEAAVQQAFNQCVRTAVAGLPRGSGGFGARGPSRQAFESAIAVCRATSEQEAATPGAPTTDPAAA